MTVVVVVVRVIEPKPMSEWRVTPGCSCWVGGALCCLARTSAEAAEGGLERILPTSWSSVGVGGG